MTNIRWEFKDIQSENPVEQVWKHLRFFLDTEYTANLHRKYMGLEKQTSKDKSMQKNLEKQACSQGSVMNIFLLLILKQ